MKPFDLAAMLVLVLVGLLAALGVWSFFQPTNCGGNSAALSACKTYLIVVQNWQDEHPGQPFEIDEVDTATAELAAEDSVFFSARLLARTGDVRIADGEPRTIVVACDQPYDNVPRRPWGAPLRHAVGYSDGQTGLISPEEFADLDLSEFVDAATLAADANAR